MIDLDAYCRRDRLFRRARCRRSTTLRALHRLHPQAIAFENLDPLLERARSPRRCLAASTSWCTAAVAAIATSKYTVWPCAAAIGFKVQEINRDACRWIVPQGVMTPRVHLLLLIASDGDRAMSRTSVSAATLLTAPLHAQFGSRAVDAARDHFSRSKAGVILQRGQDSTTPGPSSTRFDLADTIVVRSMRSAIGSRPRIRSSLFVTGLVGARAEPDRRYALRDNELAMHRLNGETERRMLRTARELRDALDRPVPTAASTARRHSIAVLARLATGDVMRRGRSATRASPAAASRRPARAAAATAAIATSGSKSVQPRQSDLRVKHSPKRAGGRGRVFAARPPREQPAALPPAPPPVAAPKPVQFAAGVQTVTVTPDENGMRVDRFFEARFPGLSFSHIQRIIRKGEVRVNGKRTQPKARLEAGQAVRIPPLKLEAPKPRDDAPQAQKDRAFIKSITLYEDADVLVLNKPMGLAVQGGSGTTRHLDGMLGALARPGPDGQRPRLVHRLDKDTAGCLLVAKTRFAAAALAKTFRSRSARKIYWALVAGVPKPKQGRISTLSRQAGGRGGFLHAHRQAWREGRRARRHLLRGGGDGGAEARLDVAQAGDRPHPSIARAHGACRQSDRRRSEIFQHRELGTARRHAEQAASAGAPHRGAASARRHDRRDARRCRRTCSSPGTCSASTPSATTRSTRRRRRSSGRPPRPYLMAMREQFRSFCCSSWRWRAGGAGAAQSADDTAPSTSCSRSRCARRNPRRDRSPAPARGTARRSTRSLHRRGSSTRSIRRLCRPRAGARAALKRRRRPVPPPIYVPETGRMLPNLPARAGPAAPRPSRTRRALRASGRRLRPGRHRRPQRLYRQLHQPVTPQISSITCA